MAGVVSLAAFANRARIDSAVSLLGRYSLEIFVAHTIASAAIRIILQQVFQIAASAPYILLCTIVGLYGPVCFAVALNRIGFGWVFIMPKRNRDVPIQEGGLSGGPNIDTPVKYEILG